MGIVASAGVCFLYSAACVCLGALILRLLDAGRRVTVDCGALTALASAFLLGQGFLAGIWELLALAGMFSLGVVVGFLSIAAVAGASFAWSILVPAVLRARQEADWLRAAPWVWKAVAFLTLVLIAMLGMAAILPPQARGDALAFYMALPKVISAPHRLLPLPGYEGFTRVGLQGEFHFAALMSLWDSTAAKLFVWPTSLAAGLMLAALGGQVGMQRR